MNLPAPPMWGNDALTSFFDGSRENQFATFHGKKAQFDRLIAIDAALTKLLNNAKNPQPWFPATIMLRVMSTFKAACALAAAGSLYEIGAMARSVIETAGYAFYMADDPKRAEIWLRRSDSPQHREAVRKEFTHGKVRAALRKNDPDAANVYSVLYEDAIDFGGHPNEKGVLRSMKLNKDESSRTIQAVLLHDDPRLIDEGLRQVEAAGLFALMCCRLIWPVRCDIIGVERCVLQFSTEIDFLSTT